MDCLGVLLDVGDVYRFVGQCTSLLFAFDDLVNIGLCRVACCPRIVCSHNVVWSNLELVYNLELLLLGAILLGRELSSAFILSDLSFLHLKILALDLVLLGGRRNRGRFGRHDRLLLGFELEFGMDGLELSILHQSFLLWGLFNGRHLSV